MLDAAGLLLPPKNASEKLCEATLATRMMRKQLEELLKDGSLMLMGPASSGKTTMLRDAAIKISKRRPVAWRDLFVVWLGAE